MIIYNIRINKKKIFKLIMIAMTILVICIGISALYSTLNSIEKNDVINNQTCVISKDVAEILPENYTNILKEVHNNIDTYVDQKISFSGYIYKANDFSNNQFVLARDMDIGNNQTLIVGFLCSYDKISDFPINSWITITGTITKGSYNNQEIPIVVISDIKLSPKPSTSSVPAPDDSYVPTAVIY